MIGALNKSSYLLLSQSTEGNQKFQYLSEEAMNFINQLWEKLYYLLQRVNVL